MDSSAPIVWLVELLSSSHCCEDDSLSEDGELQGALEHDTAMQEIISALENCIFMETPLRNIFLTAERK